MSRTHKRPRWLSMAGQTPFSAIFRPKLRIWPNPGPPALAVAEARGREKRSPKRRFFVCTCTALGLTAGIYIVGYRQN